MKPGDYLEHLTTIGEREHFGDCELRPVSTTELMSVEREAGMNLPEQYADFLCEVGAGCEHGGLAVWHHLDLSRTGNVLEASQRLAREQARALREAGEKATKFPRGMLVIYDACDGEVFGFLPASSSTYKPEVYAWDCEDFTLQVVGDDLYHFLDFLINTDEKDASDDDDDLDAVIASLG